MDFDPIFDKSQQLWECLLQPEGDLDDSGPQIPHYNKHWERINQIVLLNLIFAQRSLGEMSQEFSHQLQSCSLFSGFPLTKTWHLSFKLQCSGVLKQKNKEQKFSSA